MRKQVKETLKELLKDEEFRKEYELLKPEYQIIRAILEARQKYGITQKELSLKTGITQADISKLENGTANPSIRTLQRIAEGLGKQLYIEFR